MTRNCPEPPAAGRVSLLSPVPWLLASWLSVTVLVAPGLFAGRVLFWHDTLIALLPIRCWSADRLQAGRLPLWCSDNGTGLNLLAEGQAGVFYPPNLLSYLARVPPQTDYVLQLWLHLGLAASVLFVWLRNRGLTALAAFAGSQVYALSGFMVCHFMHLHMVQVAAWLPTLLWIADDLARGQASWRLAALAGVLWGALGLVGHPQTWMMVTIAAGLWFIARLNPRHAGRVVAQAGTVLLVGILVAAVQWLPTAAQVVSAGARRPLELGRLLRYSLDWRGLAYLFHPEIFGAPRTGDYFGGVHHYEVCGWVGVALALGLAGLAAGWTLRRHLTRPAALLVAAGLFLGLAPYNPAYKLLVHVPPFNFFRAPGRYVLLLDIAVAVLAAVAIDLLARSIARKAVLAAGVVAIGACVLAPTALAAARPKIGRLMYAEALRRTGNAAVAMQKTDEKMRLVASKLAPANPYMALWLGGGALMVAAALVGRRRLRAALLFGVVFVVVAHLYLFAVPYNPWGPSWLVTDSPTTATITRSDTTWPVVFTDPGATKALPPLSWEPWAMTGEQLEAAAAWRELLTGGTGLLYGAHQLASHYQLQPPQLRAWTLYILSDALATGRYSPGPLLAALGAGWVITTRGRLARRLPDARVVYRVPSTDIVLARLRRPRRFGLAWVPENVETVAPGDARAAMDIMTSGQWRANWAVVEAPTSLRPGRGHVTGVLYRDGLCRVAVDMIAAGPVIIAATYDPGWQAFVDGKPVPVWRANGVLCAVKVPPGQHVVELRYRPKGMAAAVAMTACGIALFLMMALTGRCRIATAAASPFAPTGEDQHAQ